jgi:hypothetical protein
VLEPIVSYGADAITITVSATPREGDQDCQGDPGLPVTITPTEPVGRRSVLDGSASSPRDATSRPS